MPKSTLGLGALEKWDITNTSKFLKLYRRHRCLWDHTDTNYKDKRERNGALAEISSGMDLPGFDTRYVVLKIRALRSTYIYERRKVRQRLKNGEKFQTHLGWYHLADSFLRNYVVEKTYAMKNEDPNKDLPPPICISDEFVGGSESKDDETTNPPPQLEFYPNNDGESQLNTSELEYVLEEEEMSRQQDDSIDEFKQEQLAEEQHQHCVTFPIPVSLSNKSHHHKNKCSTKLLVPTSCTITDQQINISNSTPPPPPAAAASSSAATLTTTDKSTIFQTTIEQGTNNNSTSNICLLRTDTDHNDDVDEFETFAKSVAMQLRKIPRDEAYGLQIQFQYLLSQAKLKAMGKCPTIVLREA